MLLKGIIGVYKLARLVVKHVVKAALIMLAVYLVWRAIWHAHRYLQQKLKDWLDKRACRRQPPDYIVDDDFIDQDIFEEEF